MAGILNKITAFCIRNKAYFIAAAIPPAILFEAYAVFGVAPFGDHSVLCLDLNAQYVYYFDYMYDVFAGKESLFYCWSGSLSGEFLGLFAYYLASPFNLIVWLFPRDNITEGIMAMQLVKCAAVSVSAAFSLRRRGFSEYTTVLFSVMYALSGYFTAQSVNPMWLDGLIALPLVLMGVERICDKRRFVLYALSLVYIFIANFYIGYMVGIFSAIYFVYFLASGKTVNRGVGEYFKSTLLYGFSSVSGILSGCWIILPVYKSLANGKLDFGKPDYTPQENFNLADCLIKLFPGTYDTIRPEGLPMLYCGTVALIFAVIYFTLRRIPLRERIAGGFMLGVMALSMYIKPVDMFWHGGQVPVWMPFRYSFIISFLLVLFGAEAFERISSVRMKTIGAVFAVLLGVLLLSDYNAGHERFDTTLIIVIPIIALAVTAAAIAAFKKHNGYLAHGLFAVLVCSELLANTIVTVNKTHDDIYYSTRESYVNEIPPTRDISEQLHELDDGFYRTEKTYHRCVNDTMAARMYGMSHSTSTFNAKVIALMKKLGYGAREHYTRYDGATLLTDDIFGVKYVLSKSPKLLPYTDTVSAVSVDDEYDAVVYENKDVLPIAYLADADLVGAGLGGSMPFEVQMRLASLITGTDENIYSRINNYSFNCENINIGSTTDAHSSYKKRNENGDAYISYTLTAVHDGAAYMYLPTKYERECALHVNESYIKEYFCKENHSIAYLGTFAEGDEFTVKLKLRQEAVYVESAMFFYVDDEALAAFNGRVHEMNRDTSVTRTSGSSLQIEVNADKDCALFTSIPYEEGWTVYIDGVERTVRSTADDTLICIEIPEGSHTVELKFFPAGLKSGLMLTGSGILMLVIMVLAAKLGERGSDGEYEDTDTEEDTEYGEIEEDGHDASTDQIRDNGSG